MPDRGGDRPAGDVSVRDLGGVVDGVGEAAEPASEHQADLRLEGAPGPYRHDRLVERSGQAEPSSRREPIIATTRSTASAGSSVT